jgi:L-lactate utilization protein LutB
MRKALLCDTFLCSSNAISEDGQLVNIDNYGNRTAAMIFGPKQVTVVAGINKVVKTVEDALVRARTIAAPVNIQRFPSIATPCNKTGEDYYRYRRGVPLSAGGTSKHHKHCQNKNVFCCLLRA